ncbi:MAG: bifunctional (p)ppGpp synthetase/guanosine-3',5'-bis(diphosphate) 3'-pyrophosphohydrolase [Porphyromonadaceae bacterium]|nr:bifunctional (p)ppGpp synthetase/guanosine-3',5'-bis(diphosphate) 3'-pyrophosphohydrolase [Porphyromonadaceae bacterium]
MFSPAQEQQIYRTSRYLLGLLQPRLDRVCRLQVRTWLAEALEQGAFVSEAEEIHTIPNFIVQLEVACLIHRELGLNVHSILAVLLYIPFSTGRISPSEIKSVCGEEVLRLLQLLARTSELYMRKEAISSENFHNLLISMAEDMRVVLIIIAYRLYLLRHASMIRRAEDRKELASEVSFLYAPIAHRLGLYKIKGEMEDLCLMYLQPKIYGFITRKLRETKDARDAYIAEFIRVVRETLLRDLQDVSFEMKGRVKSVSSISNKLKKLPFEDIYDVFAIRIIVDVPPERERQVCWQIYSIVTDMYRPNPERLKDWISIPKSNGYESLHTTVLGPENRWVEVQIRSKRMDAIAEQGVAAHWRYKGIRSEGGLDDFLASVREALETVRDDATGEEEKRQTLESSLLTLKAQEIYVFTPKGEIMKLPQGATLLDFAFTIHSRVGARAISGKVNGKNVSLRHQLKNGDNVEILTSPQQSPKPGWLSIVVSPKAKAKIRQLLRAEEEAGIGVAKEMIQRRIKNRKLPFDEAAFIRITLRKGYKTLSDFYRDLTHSKVDVQEFLNLYEQELAAVSLIEAQPSTGSARSAEDFTYQESESESNQINTSEVLILDRGLTGVAYSLAQCCRPLYGDEVFGLVTTRGIKVHRMNCPNAPDMFAHSPHKIICAKWNGESGSSQVASIEVVGRDELSIATNITSLIRKESGVKLRSYSIQSKDGLFHGSFVLYVERREALTVLIKKIRSASGVKHAELTSRL